MSMATLYPYIVSNLSSHYQMPLPLACHSQQQLLQQKQHQHCPLPLPLYKPLPCLPLIHLTHINTDILASSHHHQQQQQQHAPSIEPSRSAAAFFASTTAAAQAVAAAGPNHRSANATAAAALFGPLLLPVSLPQHRHQCHHPHQEFHDNHITSRLHSALCYERALGYGAFGIVWSACDPRNGEKVALKRIPQVFSNVIAAKRAYRELYMLASLKHTNVISLVDFVLCDYFHNFSEVYVLTQYMDTDLHKIIVSPQLLSLDHVKLFFYQILRGVKYLHSANCIHRDLKPGNLLVNSNCLIKICDFGLARVQEPHCAFLTQEVITQYYRPPELLTGVTNYSFAVDMWSVGCILAEMLSRRILFQASSPLEQLERIVDFLGTPTGPDVQLLPVEVRNYLHSVTPVQRRSRISTLSECKKAKSVLKGLLRWDPDSRLTAEQALLSPFVESGRVRFHYTLCDCCPRLGVVNLVNHATAEAAANGGGGVISFANSSSSSAAPSSVLMMPASLRFEPMCPMPLQAGFDAGIHTTYQGKVKIWSLMQEYFARDHRSVRLTLNTLATNYGAFVGSAAAFRGEVSQHHQRNVNVWR